MATESALSLYQLMGAPLQALVDAEAKAAYATAMFIKEVGFTKKEGDSKEKEGESEEDFGDLRMVTFRHDKMDSNGNKRTFKVEVPLLSLVPIPALQIRDADLDFFVKIVENPKVTKTTEIKNTEKRLHLSGLPEPLSRDLKGTIGRAQPDTSRKSSMEMQIKVRIRMEQADVPAGLGKLFNLMAENVTMRPLPPKKVKNRS